MKQLKNNEMELIIGGAITSQLINSITKAVTALFDIGKEAGSAIRRLIKGKYCPIN